MKDHEPALLAKLRGLKEFLLGEIIGQNSVIENIVPILQAGELGLAPPSRPKGSACVPHRLARQWLNWLKRVRTSWV